MISNLQTEKWLVGIRIVTKIAVCDYFSFICTRTLLVSCLQCELKFKSQVLLKLTENCRNSFIKACILLCVITSPAYSVVIQCEFRVNTTWVVLDSPYTCNIAGVTSSEITEVTGIIGDHEPGRNNSDVLGFSTIGRNFFATFPSNLDRFFPNLIGIGIWGGNLSSILSDDLAPWSNLTELYASENRIQELDGDLFVNTQRLQHVTFRGNFIQNVGINLLANLDQLTYANFANNTCINSVATTPVEIANLKVQLVAQCPPLQTTTVGCTARCSLDDEVDELRTLAAGQAQIIGQLLIRVENLENSIRT